MRVAHGALLNLAGHGAPLAAALFAVPALIEALGTERFGFLALAWALVGYVSLFDLGLGRALTRVVAERLGTPREDGLPELAQTALALTFALGAMAGGLVYLTASWVCERLLKLPPALVPEAVVALKVLALSLPLVTLTAALRGLLEAGKRFDWVNGIRVPLGVLTFVAPLAVSMATPHLAALCAALAVLRVLALAAHWAACARLMPALARPGMPRKQAAADMLGYGAWLTVSNVVGPLMVYVDRFVIGAMLSVAFVAYYTAPQEAITRLWTIPAALTGALFPAMASASAVAARELYRKGVLVILASAVPTALAAGLFAPQWLRLWLGEEFAMQSAGAARWLAFGVAVNCLAHIPFTLLQARGRADLTGKLHLAELPFYVVLLVVLVGSVGIGGAAIAWSARCAVDAIALFLLAGRELRRA